MEPGRAGDLGDARERAVDLFVRTRERTERLAARLSPEDQGLQSIPEASPAKWHRGHTTWFFETFVLAPAGVEAFDARYAFLFNSYYEASGPRHERPRRGLLSRPSAAQVGEYRHAVDQRVLRLLARAGAEGLDRALPILALGIAHEEQHQELLLTDVLHAFSVSPLRPAYLAARGGGDAPPRREPSTGPARFVVFEGGLHEIGAPAAGAFSFDNERPRHKVWVEPFALADRLVTAGEVKAFIREGGYRTPSLWLAEGLDFVRANGVTAPPYGAYEGGELRVFTLAGERTAGDDEPIAHLSYYEADAIARFLGARLPSEAEWEIAAARAPVRGNFLDDGLLRPAPARGASASEGAVRQIFGDVWEWTRSSYEPYPRYAPPAGALGEYNGKFMVNQRVLRGGSCLTPARHVRATYRNYWHPPTRFQMTGVRLAREVSH